MDMKHGQETKRKDEKATHSDRNADFMENGEDLLDKKVKNEDIMRRLKGN